MDKLCNNKTPALADRCYKLYPSAAYMARVTFPDLRQAVQTFSRFTEPFSLTRTDWMFAFHFLLVCRLEWDTLLPEV